VYNRLESPTLGQWRFEPQVPGQNAANTNTNMNVLMLVPDKNTAASKVERSVTKIKGVALAGVPETKWEALLRDIDQARAYGEEEAKGSGEAFGGRVNVQRDSRILIVAGSEAYLEMVESLVNAHRVNAEIEAKGVAASKAADAVPR
jgi:hypothetical protein